MSLSLIPDKDWDISSGCTYVDTSSCASMVPLSNPEMCSISERSVASICKDCLATDPFSLGTEKLDNRRNVLHIRQPASSGLAWLLWYSIDSDDS